jgi:hypothetical protein
MKVDWPTCQERRQLSSIVTEAVKRVFIAKENLDAAKKDKRATIADLTALTIALATARKTERETVNALHRHRNTHGC